jgi:hypothetical protein
MNGVESGTKVTLQSSKLDNSKFKNRISQKQLHQKYVFSCLTVRSIHVLFTVLFKIPKDTFF